VPLYCFTNSDESEYVDVFFHMNDNKVYVGPDGKEWRRVYTSPNASIDSKIDPFSSRDFVEKTGRKKGNLGNLMDAAKDASLARAQKVGKDPVREKWLSDYKATNKVDYFDSSKDKVVKKNGVTIDFGAK
jgi:hypothetical protein